LGLPTIPTLVPLFIAKTNFTKCCSLR
jgi:hypothetical protein